MLPLLPLFHLLTKKELLYYISNKIFWLKVYILIFDTHQSFPGIPVFRNIHSTSREHQRGKEAFEEKDTFPFII